LLNIGRSEVGCHSPILADLLDPFGSHGQGGLFLREFLKLLTEHKADLPALSDARVEHASPWAWIIGRERERIDISISNPHIGLLIFIENKIDAGEQPEQLAALPITIGHV
jgi:hypothetical protein